eukprot:gene1248-11337_t
MGNTVRNINVRTAGANLGLKPWKTLDDQEENLHTGDIILFSARTPIGRINRFHTNSNYSHVGIILKSRKAKETYVLDANVERRSVWEDFENKKLALTGSIQTIQSKLYSGVYDLVAIRKIHFVRPTTEIFGIHEEDEEEDPLFIKLLNLSKQIIKMGIHPKKYESYVSHFSKNEYVNWATAPELSMILSGEYIAYLLTELNILPRDHMKDVPKYRPSLFESKSYKLPWNKEIVKEVENEVYIYLDYQVYLEDISIRSEEPIPEYFDKDDYQPNIYIETCFDLENLQLKTGDLIFFEEMGKVSDCFERIQESHFTRVAMIIQLPGIDIPFIYDAPDFYLAQFQSQTNKKKLLEGRFMNLDSFIQSGCFKRIVIRKLCKKRKEKKEEEKKETEPINEEEIKENKPESTRDSGCNSDQSNTNAPLIKEEYDTIQIQNVQEPNDGFLTARPVEHLKKNQSSKVLKTQSFNKSFNKSFKEIKEKNVTHLYAYICLTKEKNDFQWEKIQKFFQLVKDSKIEIGGSFINVSSLFSSEILALSYAALGFIHEDDPTRKCFLKLNISLQIRLFLLHNPKIFRT